MPALYRMPVAYLAALVVGVGWYVWGPRWPSRAALEPEPVQVEPKTPPLRAPGPRLPLVLVRQLGATESAAPGGEGRPLDYLAPRDAHPVAAPEGVKAVRIGPVGEPASGWVPGDAVQAWDSRIMAVPRPGRKPIVLYREASCLLDALAGRACPLHAEACPVEGTEPTPPPEASTPFGLPVLAARAIPQPDGSDRTIFEVLCPVRDRAPIPRPDEPPPELRPLLRTVYLAIVIDSTASMAASLAEGRKLAAEVVAGAGRGANLRLALVEYRDAGLNFTARIAHPFGDPALVLQALNRIEAAPRGDGSIDEAVLDGIAMALPAAPETGSGSHLNWPTGRAGELATPMILWIGDAPDHARDTQRAETLAKLARSRGIAVAALRIDRPDLLSRDESSRLRTLRAVLTGSEESSESSAAVVAALARIAADRREKGLDLAQRAAIEAEAKLSEYRTGGGRSIAELFPVLDDLHPGEARPIPRPDPRFRDEKAPSLRVGWIAERKAQIREVDLGILLTRSELESLIDELRGLEKAALAPDRDDAALESIARASFSGTASFFAEDRGETTFADHIRRRFGLPDLPRDSPLRITRGELLQADDLTRNTLDAMLRRAIARLVTRGNASDWTTPGRTSGGLGQVRWDAVVGE